MRNTNTISMMLVLCMIILLAGTKGTLAVPPYAKLQSDIKGIVSYPHSELWNKTVAIDNSYYLDKDQKYPFAVVRPLDSYDIKVIIEFVRRYEIPFSIKGGGHSAAAYCLNKGGLVMDMDMHGKINIDTQAKMLYVRAGTNWVTVYKEFLKYPTLVPVGGTCVNVGLEGFIQGGGYSFMSRSFGLGIDNLDHATVMLSSGEEFVVSENSYPELYWAIRGGGGGNFGVVTSMALRLREIPETILAGHLCWPVAESRKVVNYYNSVWEPKVPNEMAAYGWYGRRHGKGESVFCLTFVHNGDVEEARKLIEPLFQFNPTVNELHETGFVEFLISNANLTSVDNRRSMIKSWLFPQGALNDDLITIFENAMASAPNGSAKGVDSLMLWDHAGGAIADVREVDTAFWNRKHGFAFELKAVWTDDEYANANIQWAHNVAEQLRPYAIGSYVNYIDPTLKNWREYYYGGNYNRLLSAKDRFDPYDLFKFKQAVGAH